MIIYSNLRVKMAERGFSIKDVREKTGLSRTTISNLYNGYSDGIKFNTLEALCDLFNCTPNDLLKSLEINILDSKFNILPLNNAYLIYYVETVLKISINSIEKEINLTISMELSHTEIEDIFEGILYLENSNIIEEDDFNTNPYLTNKINEHLEKYVLTSFYDSKIWQRHDISLLDIHYSWK